MFGANFIPAATNRCTLGEHEHRRDYGPLVSHIGAPQDGECVYHTQCLANRVINNTCPQCGLLLNSNSIEKFKARVAPLYEELKRAQEELDRQQETEDRNLAFALTLRDQEEVVVPVEVDEVPLDERERQDALRAQLEYDAREVSRVNQPVIAAIRPRRCPTITQNQLTALIWSAVAIAVVARIYF